MVRSARGFSRTNASASALMQPAYRAKPKLVIVASSESDQLFPAIFLSYVLLCILERLMSDSMIVSSLKICSDMGRRNEYRTLSPTAGLRRTMELASTANGTFITTMRFRIKGDEMEGTCLDSQHIWLLFSFIIFVCICWRTLY